MENEKTLIDGIVSDFYNSVEETFLYRLKNGWKFSVSWTFFTVSIGYLVLNIIPLLPSMYENYLLPIFNIIKRNLNLPLPEYNFWLKWAIGSLLSVIIWGVAYLPYKYWDYKKEKKALKTKYLNFCYIFSLRKELKNYLITENENLLDKGVSYFQKVIDPIITFSVIGESSTTLSVVKLKQHITKQFSWINFTPETERIINSLSTIDNKIIQRIKQKKEIEKIIPLVDLLILYEFSSIKPEVLNSNGVTLKEKQLDYFTTFTKELDTIDIVEEVNVINDSKTDKMKLAFSKLVNLFTTSNIMVLFISWLILLSILFVLTSILVINFLNIKLDSTLLIGLLTAPFIGAITLSATIYSKTKK